MSVDTVLIEVASLQKRLAETDAQLADSEMQLNAAKAESQRLERENHELRQILLALEKGDTSRESPGGAGDAAGADFSRSELSFTAECSASVLPAKVRLSSQRRGCQSSLLHGVEAHAPPPSLHARL